MLNKGGREKEEEQGGHTLQSVRSGPQFSGKQGWLALLIMFERQNRCISEAAGMPSTGWTPERVAFIRAWWSMLVIPTTRGAEVAGWKVQGWPELQSNQKAPWGCLGGCSVKRGLGCGSVTEACRAWMGSWVNPWDWKEKTGVPFHLLVLVPSMLWP